MIYGKNFFLTAILSFLFAVCFENATGQEALRRMTDNPVLKKESRDGFCNMKSSTSLTLPFFDDFTVDDIYPDNNKWTDNDAYVNNDFAKSPVSYGVATLDAVNSKGNIHSHLYPNIRAVSDYLTSQPVRLDSIFGSENRKLHASDSIYLSFFFQPNNWDENFVHDEGVPGDSLVLEFYSSSEDTWLNVWSTPRFPFDSIKPSENKGQSFVEVIIPIVDEEKFYHKDFQFRFKNYVTLTNSSYYPGWQVNCSQWNIDYVYLDKDRRMNGFYKDICFVNEAHSFLADYYAMPYKQYSANPIEEMLEYDTVTISNLDNVNNNVGYSYVVRNAAGTALTSYQGGSSVIAPFYTSGYYSNASVTPPVFPFIFPVGTSDSADFNITHIITSDLDFRQNDTVKFNQKFHNYYAYDDGTPEYTYTLESTSAAKVCVRYMLNVEDSLQAVKIFFNDIYGSDEATYTLCVWNESNMLPGTLMYEQEVTIEKDTLNARDFIMLRLDKPLYIDKVNFPFLAFYVGLEKTPYFNLALGFDVSRDASSNIYYNVLGTWTRSSYPGALMIRPLMGKTIPQQSGITSTDINPNIEIYPNPVSNGRIFVNIPEDCGECKIVIYDKLGRQCRYARIMPSSAVDVSGLPSGLYFVSVDTRKGFVTGKIIIE